MKRVRLLVGMNGYEVGQLVRSPGGELTFRYSPAWLDDERATPLSLSLPLGRSPYSGATVANYFDNLLPDSEQIRRRIQARFDTESTRPFDLLSEIGTDCVGAVQLVRGETLADVRCVHATPASDEQIATILRDYRARPLGMSASDTFRISIAGAQEKTAFLWHDESWHRPIGPTPTTHIFKLPIGAIGDVDLKDSVEIEWLSMCLAEALGLHTAKTEIRRFEDVTVLVVERFDRQWAQDGSWLLRLPQEDMCQALGLPPAKKYESDGGPGIVEIMQLLLGGNDPLADRAAFMRACIVYWLLAAIDGHAKNFSIQIHPGGRFLLCPVYDIVSAYPLLATRQLERQKIKMAMAVHSKHRHYRWIEIVRRHWLSTARRCRFAAREAEALLAQLKQDIPAAIEAVGSELPVGFPDHVASPIFDGLRRAGERL